MSGGGRNPIGLVPAMLAALALRASGLVSRTGREQEPGEARTARLTRRAT